MILQHKTCILCKYYKQINNAELCTRCYTFTKIPSCKCCIKFKNKTSMNEINIQIPEGYEIDIENSQIDKGIIKFKKTELTLRDIEHAYRFNSHILVQIPDNQYWIAYRNLFYIAKYLNGNWFPSPSNGARYLYHNLERDTVETAILLNYPSAGTIYFKDEATCREAIRLMGDKLYDLFK